MIVHCHKEHVHIARPICGQYVACCICSVCVCSVCSVVATTGGKQNGYMYKCQKCHVTTKKLLLRQPWARVRELFIFSIITLSISSKGLYFRHIVFDLQLFFSSCVFALVKKKRKRNPGGRFMSHVEIKSKVFLRLIAYWAKVVKAKQFLSPMAQKGLMWLSITSRHPNDHLDSYS